MYLLKKNWTVLLCVGALALTLMFLYVHYSHRRISLVHPLEESQGTTFEDKLMEQKNKKKTLVSNDRTVKATCKEAHSTRYVLALNYWEQLNMAMHNLYSLVRLVSVWEGVVVKPFAFNSRLFGLPHLRADERWSKNVSSLHLSQLFDSDNLDLLSCMNGHKMLCDFNDFLRHGNRDVVILHFIFAKEAREAHVLKGSTGDQLRHSLQTTKIFECSENGNVLNLKKDIIESLNNEAGVLGVPKFRIVKHWCINGTVKTTPQSLANHIELLKENKSIIILNWRGIQIKPMSTRVTAVGDRRMRRQFLVLPPASKMPGTKIFYPSEIILSLSSRFASQLVSGKDFIAVHIRSEKLGQRGNRIHEYVQTCVNKVFDFVRNIDANLPVIYLTDYGPYGSDSCRQCVGSRVTKTILQQHGIVPISFDPSLYGVPPDSGLVSLVEMNTLLQSRYLVLVGGGAYQKQMTMRIRAKNSHKRNGFVEETYQVCWDDKSQVKNLNTRVKYF